MTNNSKTLPWENLDPEEFGEDMVDAIRNLNSDDPEVRMESLNDLFDMGWHQGTLCWQAPFIPPFLRQFLPQGTEEEKEWILFILASFATGTSYCDTRKERPNFVYYNIKNTPEFQARLEREKRLVRDTYEAVYKGVNLYLDLLEDDSAKVKIAAAYALSCCPKDADTIIPQLQQRFHCEPDEMVKVTIPLCLTFISKTTPVDAGFFEEIINSEETDFVKLSAAVSLAYVAGEKMSDNVFEKLIQLLEIPKLFNRLEEHYDIIATAHYWMVIDFFERLGEKHKVEIIPILTRISPIYGLDTAIEVFFGEAKIPEGTTFENLTESQQLGLKALANDESTWNGSFSNTIVTGIIGIKGSSAREERQKLIDFINGEPLKYD